MLTNADDADRREPVPTPDEPVMPSSTWRVTIDVTVALPREEPTQLTRHRLVAALICTLLGQHVEAFDVRAKRLDDDADNRCLRCGGDCPTRTPRGDRCLGERECVGDGDGECDR